MAVVLLCGVPGRGRISTFLHQVIISRSSQGHTAVIGAPRPKRTIVPPTTEESSGGHQSRGRPSKQRLPITAHMLRQIKGALEAMAHEEEAVLWAVCCVAFFGFFRLGELLLDAQTSFNTQIHLAWGDVAVDNQQNPKMVRLHLKQSKTDQLGRGAHVVLGKTDQDLCPVTAVVTYIAGRGAHPGPFFLDSKRTPLNKPRFITEIRRVMETLASPKTNTLGTVSELGPQHQPPWHA